MGWMGVIKQHKTTRNEEMHKHTREHKAAHTHKQQQQRLCAQDGGIYTFTAGGGWIGGIGVGMM